MTLTNTALIVVLNGVPASPGALQPPVTRADYQRAEQLLSWNAELLVSGDAVAPRWLGESRFWYRNHVLDGHEFVLVDLSARSRRLAFDHARLAAALSTRSGLRYDPSRLPIENVEPTPTGSAVAVSLDGATWRCSLPSYDCSRISGAPAFGGGGVPSPDGRWLAFERDGNLWVRDTTLLRESPLSTDGVAHHGYATLPEQCCDVVTERLRGGKRTPVLTWSADSKKIATHRLDERAVAPIHLLEAAVGRPVLHSYRYALPGDAVIPTYELFVFDVTAGRTVRIEAEPLALLRARDELTWEGRWLDAWFDHDGRNLFFVAASRGNRQLELRKADVDTGRTRVLLREGGEGPIAPAFAYGPMFGARALSRIGKILWWSDRDGWGHLYLHAAVEGGQRATQITRGEWLVHDVVHVDVDGRWIYFTAAGREPGRNPYFRHLYRVKLDGSALTLLTPEDADHDVSMSPGGRYIVDTHSRYDAGPAPITVVRERDGRIVMTVEKADISRLLAAGWRWPESLKLKARDGITDLYGVLHRPSNFDPRKKYGVIDLIYPGPSAGAVRGWDFHLDSPRQAMAELGFLVVSIDAMGTPGRSRAFWDVWSSELGDASGIGEFGILDHVAVLKQLGERHPEMDLSRVGVWGHSGGGGAALNAMLRFPDLFKVGVASAGNHDSRSYAYDWGEKWQGLRERRADAGDNYDLQANQRLAAGLKGKLLLAYSGMDDNVHPNLSWVVMEQLISHNKDFDLLVMPNQNHSFNRHPYMIRRTWDYFVQHLRGEEPPPDYAIRGPTRDAPR